MFLKSSGFSGKSFRNYYAILSDIYGSEFSSQDFELEYARIEVDGLCEIAKQYNQDPRYRSYNLSLEIEEFPFQKTEEFYKKLKEKIDHLQEGEVRGVVFVEKYEQEVGYYHAAPFIIARVQGRTILVNFEPVKNPKILGAANIFKECRKYFYLQKDENSCAIFSINTLKNCLCDSEFLAQLINPEVKILELPKEIMGQGSDYLRALTGEKREKYGHSIPQLNYKCLNLKAFYKGHDYARRINPFHLDLLSKNTRDLILKIDKKRQGIKIAKAQVNPDLPSAAVKPVDNTSLQDRDKEGKRIEKGGRPL